MPEQSPPMQRVSCCFFKLLDEFVRFLINVVTDGVENLSQITTVFWAINRDSHSSLLQTTILRDRASIATLLQAQELQRVRQKCLPGA